MATEVFFFQIGAAAIVGIAPVMIGTADATAGECLMRYANAQIVSAKKKQKHHQQKTSF